MTAVTSKVSAPGRARNQGSRADKRPSVAMRTGALGPLSKPDRSAIASLAKRRADRTTRDQGTSRTTPPTSARGKPSTSNCRTTRQRLAPSARRIAISFRRAVPRARSMLARLRQATSRTTPAIPIRSGASLLDLAAAARAGAEGEARERRRHKCLILLLDRKGSLEIRGQVFKAGAAAAAVRPGFKRATIMSCRPARSVELRPGSRFEIVRELVVHPKRHPDFRRENVHRPGKSLRENPDDRERARINRITEPSSAGLSPCFFQ